MPGKLTLEWVRDRLSDVETELFSAAATMPDGSLRFLTADERLAAAAHKLGKLQGAIEAEIADELSTPADPAPL